MGGHRISKAEIMVIVPAIDAERADDIYRTGVTEFDNRWVRIFPPDTFC